MSLHIIDPEMIEPCKTRKPGPPDHVLSMCNQWVHQRDIATLDADCQHCNIRTRIREEAQRILREEGTPVNEWTIQDLYDWVIACLAEQANKVQQSSDSLGIGNIKHAAIGIGYGEVAVMIERMFDVRPRTVANPFLEA